MEPSPAPATSPCCHAQRRRAIHPAATPADGSIGTLSLTSLNASAGGDLRFDLGSTPANADLITVSGAANFSNSDTISLNFAATPANGTYTYVLLTAGSANLSVSNKPTLTTTNIGRTNFSIITADFPNEIAVQAVVNGAATLTWENTGGGDGSALGRPKQRQLAQRFHPQHVFRRRQRHLQRFQQQ